MNASFTIMATVLLCAGVSAAGISYWAVPRPSTPVQADPVVFGSIPAPATVPFAGLSASLQARSVSPPAIFSVSNFTRKTVCLVERGAALTSRSRDFFAPPDCEQVWPGLSRASNWTQNEDGSVTISDAGGMPLLTLVRGERFSYEATDVPDADLALLMLP